MSAQVVGQRFDFGKFGHDVQSADLLGGVSILSCLPRQATLMR